jgi:hypothetical protein
MLSRPAPTVPSLVVKCVFLSLLGRRFKGAVVHFPLTWHPQIVPQQQVTGRLSSGGVSAAADVEQPLLQMTVPGLVREHLMGDTQDLLHFLIPTFRGVGTWMVIGRWPVS